MQTKSKIGLGILSVIIVGGLGIMIFSPSKSDEINQTNTQNTPYSYKGESEEDSDDDDSPNNYSSNTSSTTTTATPAITPTGSNTSGKYTLATVATHNSASNCWTAVSGNVYDLTAWIAQHPGGNSPIISMCGIDATQGFLAQHKGQRKPESALASFLLGPLTK